MSAQCDAPHSNSRCSRLWGEGGEDVSGVVCMPGVVTTLHCCVSIAPELLCGGKGNIKWQYFIVQLQQRRDKEIVKVWEGSYYMSEPGGSGRITEGLRGFLGYRWIQEGLGGSQEAFRGFLGYKWTQECLWGSQERVQEDSYELKRSRSVWEGSWDTGGSRRVWEGHRRLSEGSRDTGGYRSSWTYEQEGLGGSQEALRGFLGYGWIQECLYAGHMNRRVWEGLRGSIESWRI